MKTNILLLLAIFGVLILSFIPNARTQSTVTIDAEGTIDGTGEKVSILLTGDGPVYDFSFKSGALPATCKVGETFIDTAGATIERCFCTGVDSWHCADLHPGASD